MVFREMIPDFIVWQVILCLFGMKVFGMGSKNGWIFYSLLEK